MLNNVGIIIFNILWITQKTDVSNFFKPMSNWGKFHGKKEKVLEVKNV